MNKHELIAKLRKAKTAHIRWRSYAQALVLGVPMDEGKIPVLHTDCEFGSWYYGEGQALAGLAPFRAIEEPHEQLHAIYMEIFKHLFGEQSGGLFRRLIGRRGAADKNRQNAIKSLLDELLKISERLIGQIEGLEGIVVAMDEAQLAELY